MLKVRKRLGLIPTHEPQSIQVGPYRLIRDSKASSGWEVFKYQGKTFTLEILRQTNSKNWRGFLRLQVDFLLTDFKRDLKTTAEELEKILRRIRKVSRETAKAEKKIARV